jgi:hypothetical protein
MNSNTNLQFEKTTDIAKDKRLSAGTKEFLKILNSPTPPKLEKLSRIDGL